MAGLGTELPFITFFNMKKNVFKNSKKNWLTKLLEYSPFLGWELPLLTQVLFLCCCLATEMWQEMSEVKEQTKVIMESKPLSAFSI